MLYRGVVVPGDKLGRKLGYPTANLKISPTILPKDGVYAGEVFGDKLGVCLGAVSVGRRPTVAGNKRVFEVYIPGFKGNLYGTKLQVSLVKKIRGQKKFASIEDLKRQIAEDVRKILSLKKEDRARDRQTPDRKKTSRLSGLKKSRPKKA